MIPLELAVILILIFLNGVFAMAEIAILSSRKEKLLQLVAEGDKNAQSALDLANEPNIFLSTVQIGITLVGILAGAFGGATLAEEISVYIAKIPFIGIWNETVAFLTVVIFITYMSVVFGEIIPKRLALIFPEKIASFIASPMFLLSKTASPVVKIFSYSTEFILKLLGLKDVKGHNITEEEILVLLEMGKQAGTVEEEEKNIVDNVFTLGDKQISSLMTPRNQIVWLDIENNKQDNLNIMNESCHTTFPVCKGNLESVIGVAHSKNIIHTFISGHETEFASLLDKPLFIPDTMKGFKALKLFKETGKHFALAVDEYGVVQGIITLTDIFEAIVGDIPTMEELSNPQAVRREDGSWLLDGMIEIAEFKKLFEINELPYEDEGDYNTLGGFIIYKLEKIPTASDYFEWEGFRFEVVDMDSNRVDKVLLSLTKDKIETEEN